LAIVTQTRTGELIPLSTRVRSLSLFRVAAVAFVVLSGVLWSGPWRVSAPLLVAAGAGYCLLAAAVGAAHLRGGRRALPVLGLTLLVDAVGLQALVFVTGAATSPLRYLLLAHVVVVALVASYRTGLKLAIWHSLLLLVLHEAAEVGLLAAWPDVDQGPGPLIAALWLATIATSTASSVNERELRRRRYESEALAQMATTLEATTFPLAVAEVVTATAMDVLDATRAVLIDVREEAALLAGKGRLGSPGPAPIQSLLERVTRLRQPVLVTAVDPRTDPWLAAVLPAAANIALLPLVSQSGTVAVLVIEHRARAGTRLEARVLAAAERIADHAALSLSNAWLHERLAEHALTDALTGLMNRRAFDEVLHDAAADPGPLAFLLLDLDHFKQINDTKGHATGDGVLRAVGGVLADAVPAGGTAARFGGEEFAIVLPGVTAGEAARVAEAARSAIAGAQGPAPVTASIGLCQRDQGPHDPAAIAAAADAALYAAKRDGRNRVAIDDLDDLPGSAEHDGSAADRTRQRTDDRERAITTK
jgi:two-component system, cell cycle response regulator